MILWIDYSGFIQMKKHIFFKLNWQDLNKINE